MPIKMSLDPQLTKQVISILGEVVDEFRLQMSKDGWKVAVVDPANVALIRSPLWSLYSVKPRRNMRVDTSLN